jgi:uroporphyrinogen decarboxylase
MIAGRGTPDQAPARLALYREPDRLMRLLDILAEHSADYLIRQIRAGADVVQIFDSWSGVLDDAGFDACCIQPVAEIVRRVRAEHPDVPIIGFPKGAGQRYEDYRRKTGVTAVGIDWTVPLEQAAAMQQEGAIQGNLDPLRLVAGGEALDSAIDAILEALGQGPLVFNLGHGITPETPIGNVEAMLTRLRSAVRGRS